MPPRKRAAQPELTPEERWEQGLITAEPSVMPAIVRQRDAKPIHTLNDVERSHTDNAALAYVVRVDMVKTVVNDLVRAGKKLGLGVSKHVEDLGDGTARVHFQARAARRSPVLRYTHQDVREWAERAFGGTRSGRLPKSVRRAYRIEHGFEPQELTDDHMAAAQSAWLN